ncbi:PfkB family carbohydrate kinase [Catellatospora sp. KI3]|uniref:carbohydrate kinase family protein n=1 Tax=Catellatospora sp. KI3 TaxID=3041620 RepID=UPI00248309D6|nr:PfkB family carbohydrate kinase [Catellatospora sp. KI3]MDI1464934.1 PfkB family carbohydrate kinase [Catellatospora sp. KI3]
MILTVGDLVTDVLAVLRAPLAPGSDTPATVHVAGGGQAANTAAWLAAIGAPVTFVGAVGDDQAGRDRLAELHLAGVRTQVSVRPGAATGSIVVLTHEGERTFITDRGANLLLAPADVDAAIGHGGQLLHLSGYTLLDQPSRPAGRRALAAARAAGLRTSVDAASAAPLHAVTTELIDDGPTGHPFLDWVRGVDLLLANTDEATALAGPGTPAEQAMALSYAIGGQVVVKLGPFGALWAGPGGVTHLPTEPAPMVDATGAGDAFAAGLLHAWMSGADPMQCLQAACLLGAQAVGHVGARPPLPR